MSSWNTSAGGGGTAPASFTAGDSFVIQSGHTMTLSANWTVNANTSGAYPGIPANLTVSSGATLDLNNKPLSLGGSFANSGTLKSTGASAPVITFTGSGAYGTSATLTPGMNSITVAAQGGGGGGGRAQANDVQGGGGGGGACAYSTFVAVSPATSYTLNVGAGGLAGRNNLPTPGTSGAAGGNSSLSGGSITTITGGGAGGGTVATSGGSTAGSAGSATGGNAANNAGGTGAASGGAGGGGAGGGSAGTTSTGGNASGATGGSAGTGSPAGAVGAASTSNTDGVAGTVPGSGGSGGWRTTGAQTSRAGGAGANGQVTVTFYNTATVSSPTQSSIGTTSANLGATVSANGNTSLTDYGIVWATTASPTTADNKVQVGTSDPTFPSAYTVSAGSMPVNTLIYYRGYAVNAAGTAYSSLDSFWTLANTPAAPTVGTPTSSSLNVAIGSGDGNPFGTVYAIQETEQTGGQYVQADGSLGASAVYRTVAQWGSAVTVTGLNSGTHYTFQVKAQNGGGTDTSFGLTAGAATTSGATAPVVTASAATSITANAATLNGNVTADGGASITDRGFVYKSGSSGVTISDNKTQVGSGIGAFSTSVSLSPNVRYYWAAYATNTVGTTLSSELDFWTQAATPAAPTVSTPGANKNTTLNVALGSDSNPSGTVYAIQETTSGNYVQANGTLGASAVYQTSATWGTTTVTSLTPSTTYTFRVKAQNGGGTDSSFGSTASLATLINDYRSRASGNWDDFNTWSVNHNDGNGWQNAVSGETPGSLDASVLIQSGDTVTVASGASGKNLTVNSSGTLVATAALTLSGTTTINGTYRHNLNGSTIPSATWGSSSTCEVTGITTTAPTGTGQAFNHVTWNCTSQSVDITPVAAFTSIGGNLLVSSTGGGSAKLYLFPNAVTPTGLTVGGNFTVSSGAIVYITPDTTVKTVTVNGDVSIAGDFNGEPNSTGNGVLAFGGTANQNFSITGTLDGTSAQKKLNVTVNANAIVTLTSGVLMPAASTRTLTVDGTLNCGTHAVTGIGRITVGATGTLKLGSLDAGGALSTTASTGNIQLTGTRTYTAGCTIVFNGNGAQVIGNGLASTPKVEIDNANGVSLSGATSVGNLALTSGALSLGANTLTLNGTVTATGGSLTGGTTSSITCAGSTAVTLPAVSGGLKTLTVNNAGGVAIGGAITLNDSANALVLTSGAVTGAGNLTFASGATLKRDAGSLDATPAGTGYHVTYTTTTGGVTTGPELPNTAAVQNVTFLNSSGTDTLGGNVTVNGNLTTTAGGTVSDGGYTLTFKGATVDNNSTFASSGSGKLLVAGTGTQTLDSHNSAVYGNVEVANTSATVFLSAANSFAVNTPNTFTITSGATVQSQNKGITGTGNFTMQAGATLIVGNGVGIDLGTGSGVVRVSGTHTFEPAANYIIRGFGGNCIMGTGFPVTVSNLTINVASGFTATLQNNVMVNGTFVVSTNLVFDFNGYTITAASTAISNTAALKMAVTKTAPNTFTGSKLTQTAGTLTYGGALNFTAAGDALAVNDSVTLFSAPAIGGSFSSMTLPVLSSGLAWDTNSLATSGVLDVYSFTTTPLEISTPMNSNAVVSATKLANHVSSGKLAAAYPATGWSASASTPANGGSVAVNGNGSLTYTPAGAANVNGGTDSFTVTFNDGHGTQTMAVSVTVGSGNGTSPNLLGQTVAGSNFVLRFAGYPGQTYTVETNQSVGPGWAKLGNVTAPGDGIIALTNTMGTNSLFFRTVWPGY